MKKWHVSWFGLASLISLLLAWCVVDPAAYASPASDGAGLFKTKCAMCHAPDGSGNTPMGSKLKLRDLRSPDVQKQTDTQLIQIISAGKPPMPAFGKSLSEADIHNLVVFLRNLQPKA